MKRILSQEDLNNILNSTGSGIISCCLIEDNMKFEFDILAFANNYILDYNGDKALIEYNQLMESPIGRAIKNGNLYMLEYGDTKLSKEIL